METAHKECICPEVHLSFPGIVPLRRMTWGFRGHLGTTLECKAQPLLSRGSGVCEWRRWSILSSPTSCTLTRVRNQGCETMGLDE